MEIPDAGGIRMEDSCRGGIKGSKVFDPLMPSDFSALPRSQNPLNIRNPLRCLLMKAAQKAA